MAKVTTIVPGAKVTTIAVSEVVDGGDSSSSVLHEMMHPAAGLPGPVDQGGVMGDPLTTDTKFTV